MMGAHKTDVATLPNSARLATVRRLLDTQLHGARRGGAGEKKKVAELEMAIGFLAAIDEELTLAKTLIIQFNTVKLEFANQLKRIGGDVPAESSCAAAANFIENTLEEKGL